MFIFILTFMFIIIWLKIELFIIIWFKKLFLIIKSSYINISVFIFIL